MIDIETIGTRSIAPIVAIGAVSFTAEGGVSAKFYDVISIHSALNSGAKPDGDTIAWWLQQSADARGEMASGTTTMSAALKRFSQWIPDSVAGVWGNGASFDNAIIAETYARMGLQMPWKYSLDRCYRTVKSLSDVPEIERQGTYHNALDDAEHQANNLINIWNVEGVKR